MRLGKMMDTIDKAAVSQFLEHDYASQLCLNDPAP